MFPFFDFFRRSASLSFLFLLAIPAKPAPADWAVTEGGAVKVHAPAEPAAAAAARRLAEGVEARRLLLASILERPLEPTTPVAFYFLPDAGFGQEFGVAPGNVRTLKREHRVLATAVLPFGAAQERQLLEGAVEALLADHLSALPVVWRNGFAEFLLDAELTPQGVRPLATPERLEALKADEWLSLSQFSELDLERYQPETRKRLASQVWALLYHDTVVAPKKKEKLVKFLRATLAGESASTAYMTAYGTYYDDVQIDVRDASRRSNGQAFTKFTSSIPVKLPPFRERPLAPADSEAELGLLLVELPSPSAAAARCGAARELQPENSRALLCEARLLEQSGELVAARAGYEKAASAAPGDGEIEYFAGSAWLRMPRRPTRPRRFPTCAAPGSFGPPRAKPGPTPPSPPTM